jgi:hypothetical protein
MESMSKKATSGDCHGDLAIVCQKGALTIIAAGDSGAPLRRLLRGITRNKYTKGLATNKGVTVVIRLVDGPNS